MDYTERIKTKTFEKDERYLWGLFLLFPLAALIVAIRNFDTKSYRKFIWFFGILYGISFISISDSDSTRYAKKFSNLGEYSFDRYLSDVKSVFEGDLKNLDIYSNTLMFIGNKIGTNPQIFYFLTAFFYFFVFVNVYGLIWDHTLIRENRLSILFLIGAVFVFNFAAGINGVRFAMAAMVFMYGTLKYIFGGEKKYLLIAALSALIHFIMLYSIIFLFLFAFIPLIKKEFVLYFLFGIGIISISFLSEFIQSNISFLGAGYESRVLGFTSQKYITQRVLHTKQWNWYVELNLYALYIFALLALILSRLNRWGLQVNDIAKNLFSFTLLMAFASVVSANIVDPISNRYNAFVIFFALVYLFYLSSLNPKSAFLKYISYLYIPVLVLRVLVLLRGDLYTMSPVLFLGNPFIMLFYKFDISIQTLLLG